MKRSRVTPVPILGNRGASNRPVAPISGSSSANIDSMPIEEKTAVIPSMGVSIGFLKSMKDIIKTLDPESGQITVSDVIEKYIKPWTEGSNLPLMEHFKKAYSLDLHPVLKVSYYSEYFSEATVFVSYARKYTFDGLVDALECFEQNNSSNGNNNNTLDDEDEAPTDANTLTIRKEKKIYFWIDILSINQFVRPDNKINLDLFSKLIGQIGETCLVAMPWNNPIPFKRTWCLFEILATQLSGATLTLQLSKTRHPKFLNLLADNYESAIKQLNLNIDVEFSEASSDHEKALLLDVFLKLDDGCHHANSIISQCVRHWAYCTAVRGVRTKMKTEK